jgi:hypothetical protein
MEQPMMRNEHIVRAHQAPVQAINPFTSNPWRVIHVDNTATNAATGDGTAQSPFTKLADPSGPNANAAANQPFDVVYVHQGNSSNSPYQGPYVFSNNNQYLVGEGTSLTIPTVNCGYLALGADFNLGSDGKPTGVDTEELRWEAAEVSQGLWGRMGLGPSSAALALAC